MSYSSVPARPDWLDDWQCRKRLPEVLEFPWGPDAQVDSQPIAREVTLEDEPEVCYGELIVWTIVQTFWLKCLSQPQCHPQAYTAIVDAIRQMEDEMGLRSEWSPCQPVSKLWDHVPEHYPDFIRRQFVSLKYKPLLASIPKVQASKEDKEEPKRVVFFPQPIKQPLIQSPTPGAIP